MITVSIKDFIVWTSFQINQSYIAEFLCVNRYQESITVCGGSCYLETQLLSLRITEENETPKSPPKYVETTELKLFKGFERAINLSRNGYHSLGALWRETDPHFNEDELIFKMLRPPQL